MKKIIKQNGYIYLREGYGVFVTDYYLGKDPDDPRWKEEITELGIKPKKKNKKKKTEE